MKVKKISESGADLNQIEMKRRKFVADYSREALQNLTKKNML